MNNILTGDWLREIVFGLNDGLVTTLVFIMAVSQIAQARLLLVVLGEVLAGGISMALGGYLSARTARQILEQRIATTRTRGLLARSCSMSSITSQLTRNAGTGLWYMTSWG